MMTKAQSNRLGDNKRLHLNHGPIDLIIEAFGKPEKVESAYKAVDAEFKTLLSDLVTELAALRRPAKINSDDISTKVGLRMLEATVPFSSNFITPMAAVAGSVADYMLQCLCQETSFKRAYVNNGGDIALHLSEGESFEIGLIGHPKDTQLAGTISISEEDKIGGIATSGRHGRSHSLGIADSVTVLAHSAAIADAAATMIANAVDLPGSPAVSRKPANELSPDSDLGERLVTIEVSPLSPRDARKAIERGYSVAKTYQSKGLIRAAWISLQGLVKVTSPQHLLTTYKSSDVESHLCSIHNERSKI